MYQYGNVYLKAVEATSLARRNKILEDKHRKFVVLEEQLNQIEEKNRKIMKMLGISAKGRSASGRDKKPKEYVLSLDGLPEAPPKGQAENLGLQHKKDITLNSPPHPEFSLKQEDITPSSNKDLREAINEERKSMRSIPLIYPVKGWITKTFSFEHPGIDIACPFGTPVMASINGVVNFTKWDTQLGNIIEIENDGGFKIVYGHTSRMIVKQGDWVEQGDVVAFVGSTGKSSAPHLHYEVYYDGKPIDPMIYLLK